MPVSDRRAAVQSALVLDRTSARPRAAVLVLHGGRSKSERPPGRINPPGVRMWPFSRAVLRATDGYDVVVGRVRYRYQGWNGGRADAARDARRALDELEELAGPVPVVLVGHSMGGRAALAVAGHDRVSGVVALAPWCPRGEPVEQLAGCRAVLLHGDRDRVTDPRETVELAARARAAGAEACAVLLPGGDHAMLRRAATWHRLTTGSVTALLGMDPYPEAVRRAHAGSDPVQSP
ncbi:MULTISPECIES: alpha/beta hydrolase [Streptomyces]|uniref:alpha/beta hydrolase n=1 Tax=Streptomyces TaxID=1883 RepID=UPI0006256783|nr:MULTISPECIES: alpha/beta hydrolase [Streptomyces]QXE33418.1 alpha/beta hydrolase [Streptomyces sp. GMY02]